MSVDRLKVIYEVNSQQFMAAMRQMAASARETNKVIASGAKTAESGIRGLQLGIKGNMLATSSTLALAVSAMAISMKKLLDPFIQLENRLTSIGETSTTSTMKLIAAANRARTGANDFATAVARIQKATGASYDDTVRRVETVTKLMRMGGATGGEATSVNTQLSQALQSGVLQGDEFRSLRENAPVELMQAIAKAAGTTVQNLKEFSKEGKITSDIVIKAIDSMAESADNGFSSMKMTSTDAMTVLGNSVMVAAGQFDKGAGFTASFTESMSELSTWLTDNADKIEEFGAKTGRALSGLDEWTKQNSVAKWFQDFDAWSNQAAASMLGFNTEVMDAPSGLKELGEAGSTAWKAVGSGAEWLTATISGVLAALEEGFLTLYDALGRGASALFKELTNAVVEWVNTAIRAINMLIGAVNALPGSLDIGLITELDPEKIGKVFDYKNMAQGIGVIEAYNKGFDATKASIDAAAEAKAKFDATKTGEANIAEQVGRVNRQFDELTAAYNAPAPPSVTPDAGGSTGAGWAGKKSGGAARGEQPKATPLEQFSQDMADTEFEISNLYKTTQAAAEAAAQYKLINEYKQAGIPITAETNRQIEDAAKKFGELTVAQEQGQFVANEYETLVDGLATSFADAIIAGKDLRSSLANVFKQIASDFLSAGLSGLMKQLFSGITSSGAGGGWGSIIGGLFGGFKAGGGRTDTGKAYVVGEKEPELFVPDQAGSIFNQDQIRAAQAKQGGGDTTQVQIVPSDMFKAVVKQIAAEEAQSAAAAVVKGVPNQIRQYEANRRVR